MCPAPGLGRNINPQQHVMQQQSTDPMPPYQFQHASYNMMPLQQTIINRAQSTSNNKNSPKNEPEIKTNYTWQLVEKKKRSNRTTEGNPFLFNTQNRYVSVDKMVQ
jgi:hypothetical protein